MKINKNTGMNKSTVDIYSKRKNSWIFFPRATSILVGQGLGLGLGIGLVSWYLRRLRLNIGNIDFIAFYPKTLFIILVTYAVHTIFLLFSVL